MKRIIAILAACMMLTCSFASCGNSDDSSESSSKKKSSAKTTAAADDEDDSEDDDEDNTKASKKSSKKSTKNKSKNDDDDDDNDDDDNDDEDDNDDDEDDNDDDNNDDEDGNDDDGNDDEDDNDDDGNDDKDDNDDDDNKGNSGAEIVQTTHNSKNGGTSAASSDSIIGKWSIPKEVMTELDVDFNNLPDGMELEEMFISFSDDNKMLINVSFDFSSLMYLDDNGFYMSGMTFNEVSYDGTVLKVTAMNKDIISFTRLDTPDKNNMYGRYSAGDTFGKKDDVEYSVNFVEPKKSIMEVYNSSVYKFDESTGKLSLEGREHSVDVDFDGNDNMKWTSEDGKQFTLERID